MRGINMKSFLTLFLLSLTLISCSAFKSEDTSEGRNFFYPPNQSENLTDSLDGIWLSAKEPQEVNSSRYAIVFNSDKDTFIMAKECTHESFLDFRAYAFVKVQANFEDSTDTSKGFVNPKTSASKETKNKKGLIQVNCSVEIKDTDRFKFDRRNQRIATFYEITSEDNLRFTKITD